MIKFGVNLDIGNWKEQCAELYNKVPSGMCCSSEDDILFYLRQHINGMTVPQLYIKVAHCWTGAHEENLRFRAINFNHGPGDCIW